MRSCCTICSGFRSKRWRTGWGSSRAPPRFDRAAPPVSCGRCSVRNVMSKSHRDAIINDLAPVRPLPKPSRRVWLLVPIGLLLAATAPFVNGIRGDLLPYAPLLTWGATGLQAVLGLWLLALGFREAVPGRNVSALSLASAAVLTVMLVSTITVLTNAASATVVPAGREWRDWMECVVWPAAIGSPFMVIATLM